MEVWLRELKPNLFLIQFSHKKDFERVVNDGPWTFDQPLFVFQSLGNDANPHEVELNQVDFLVQVYNIPVGYCQNGWRKMLAILSGSSSDRILRILMVCGGNLFKLEFVLMYQNRSSVICESKKQTRRSHALLLSMKGFPTFVSFVE